MCPINLLIKIVSYLAMTLTDQFFNLNTPPVLIINSRYRKTFPKVSTYTPGISSKFILLMEIKATCILELK